MLGQIFDEKYRIEKELGQGGMGSVFLATELETGNLFALKLLSVKYSSDADPVERFKREAEAARRLHHPNAVAVYDLRETDYGIIYMVMEYVEGHTLREELKRRDRLSPAEALALLGPIANVLYKAHENGVVHRDLKPENIMLSLDHNGVLKIKLLDLGIAKMYNLSDSSGDSATDLTTTGQILGTPFYMSPEQWGEPPRDATDGEWEIDGRADIYSLGVIFYEMISGEKPFRAVSLPKLANQHINFMPPLLHELISNVPELFSRAVACAMAKDRSDRYSTAQEFAEDLRTSLGDVVINYSLATLNATADSSNSATITEPTLSKGEDHEDTKDTKIF